MNWETQFEKEFAGATGYVNPHFSKLIKEFIKDLLKEEREKGRAEENKEFREGRRCEICGEPSLPNHLSRMCKDCFENG